MFTGLVETTGKVISVSPRAGGARLEVCIPDAITGLKQGDSIAVNGCCLTVAAIQTEFVAFDLLQETLDRTNLGQMQRGRLINLERPMTAGARLDGHFVQGHIDSAAEVLAYEPAKGDHRLEVAIPNGFAQYLVSKGSIAVDGISLTVAELKTSSFVCWIIPHTHAITALADRKTGDTVNLEFDVLAKYVERIMAVREGAGI